MHTYRTKDGEFNAARNKSIALLGKTLQRFSQIRPV